MRCPGSVLRGPGAPSEPWGLIQGLGYARLHCGPGSKPGASALGPEHMATLVWGLTARSTVGLALAVACPQPLPEEAREGAACRHRAGPAHVPVWLASRARPCPGGRWGLPGPSQRQADPWAQGKPAVRSFRFLLVALGCVHQPNGQALPRPQRPCFLSLP